MLANKREVAGLKHFNDSAAFIEWSNHMDDIYKNIKDYNPNKIRRTLIGIDDMIADMLSNKRLNPIVTELFIGDRKLKIFLVFITQSCFAVPKNIGLNSIQYSVMKIPKKRQLQQIAFNHSSDIDFQDFMDLYKSILYNHILFWWLILLLTQMVFPVSKSIFQKKYKS